MNSAVSALSFYLWPLLAQVALAYVIAALILVTRLNDLLLGPGTEDFYRNYAGAGGPPLVQRTTRQLANLFEFPVVFFALICLLVATGIVDPAMRIGAGAFVVARWAHALVHLFANRLWIRTPIFMAGNLVLLAMWGRLAYLAH